ncbi:MAG: glycoside hydrolase family 36 protein [Promethearchaeota archaeon]
MIIQDNENKIEIDNSIVSLIFIKKGKDHGTFEINHHHQYTLKHCYSAINILNENSESIWEIPSKGLDFNHQIEEIKDNIGSGIKVILKPQNNKENDIKFHIQFRVYENQSFILIKITDIAVTKNDFQKRIHSISPLTIKNENLWISGTSTPTDLEKISWFKNGWQSWSPCKIIYGNEEDNEGPVLDVFKRTFDNQDYIIKGRFYSEDCTAITDLTSNVSLILGFITLNTQFTRILLDYKETEFFTVLAAFGCMDGIQFDKSSIDCSEELFVCFKSDNLGYYGLIEYAKLIKLNHKVKDKIPTGWCSWYYYFTNVSENDIIKNLVFFQNDKNLIPIDFFQLDDGYFTHIGDFNDVNSKFPSGLYSLFKRINNSGFKGGIWTAPFFAEKKAMLFKQHRDWFLKYKDLNKLIKVHFGASWNVYLYGLDLSNPQVLDYLSHFYGNLIDLKDSSPNNNSSLITFFKIDFLHAAVPIEAKFFNPNLTRAQILYNGVKTIRDAISVDSFLLGCGAPLGPCVGLVDAMRIGEDTAPRWEERNQQLIESGIQTPGLKVSLINIIYRSFMHRKFWINDPDCLMIRRTDTELTIEEIRLQLTIMGLSCGQILISDDITQLSEEEIKDAKLLIPPYNPNNFHPIAVDAFTSKLPTIFMLETNQVIGKRFLVAIINWENNFVNKKVNIKKITLYEKNETNFLIFDYWNKKFLGLFKTHQDLLLHKLAPHSCRYLAIIPIDDIEIAEPVLLSTTLHITQGCIEIKQYEFKEEEGKLLIEFELIGKRDGNFYLKLPHGRQIIDHDDEVHIIDKNNNIWELYIKFENKKIIQIQLS